MVLYSPTVTGSLSLAGGTITVSGSVINNLTASFAQTASFALNAGGGAAFPFIGVANITGSLIISSSNASSSLVLRGSGSGVFTVDGTSGRLFSVDDSLSGSLFSVNTIAGLPVIEAFSDNTVRIGQYNKRALFVSQSVVGINKETALNGVLDISGSAVVTGSLIVSGSTNTIGDVSGSNARFTGTITAQTLVVQVVSSSIEYASGSNIFGTLSTNTQRFTGSVLVSGSITVSGSVINNLTSSFAISASWAPGGNAVVFPYTGSALITGSLGVTGSVGLSYLTVTAGTWTAGGALITARCSLAGAGTQNSALAFGGYVGFPVNATVACTEAYNGATWTAGGAMITARSSLAGAGASSTAALAFGGFLSPANRACTEAYNGTSWSAGGALITARSGLAGAGTSTAALAFGGGACTEAYNGTSWTAGGAMITTRQFLAGAGTSTSALAFGGGSSPSLLSCTEAYNGTSWSAGGALGTARYGLAGAGTSTSALAFGGCGAVPSVFTCTEAYNGTSWTAGGAMIQARAFLGGAGTQNSALAFGGAGFGIRSCTEAFTIGVLKTFDYSNTTGNISATGSLFGTSSFAISASWAPAGITTIDTGSLVTTSSFNAYTSSINATIADILIETASINRVTASLQLFSASLFSYTASNNANITALNLATASLNNYTSSLNAKTGSFATTGSNTFTADQIIQGNLTVNRIIVQTITASQQYSSGSNVFGNLSSNNQVFTGSVLVSGSITVSGSVINNLTASYAVSASQAISASYSFQATSASFAISASWAPPLNTSSLVTTNLLNGFTASINAQTASLLSYTSSLNSITSSFAITGSNTFRGNQTITGSLRVSGSVAITGSIESTGPIYSIGENRMSQGTFNDPTPNINAVLKLSTIPAASLLTTVIGARISGSATPNFDTYAGYFNNASTVSGNGMAYGIFASGSFHNFGGETRFYQGTFNDPVAGTAASVKISAVPVTSTPTAVFTVGITGTATSNNNTFAGYFANSSTVSGTGRNYGIYAIGTNHYLSGSLGINKLTPSAALDISGSLLVTGSISVSGSVINTLTSSFAISASAATTASFATNVIPITSKTMVIGNNNYIQPYDTGSFVFWRVPYPITASSITAFSTSSLGPTSGSQVSANKNGSLLLVTPLAVTTSTWVSSSTLQNQNFNTGDVLGFNFLTLTGSLTQIVIQVDFIK